MALFKLPSPNARESLAIKADWDTKVRGLGHDPGWRIDHKEWRATCTRCGGTMLCSAGGNTTDGPIDLRRTPCPAAEPTVTSTDVRVIGGRRIETEANFSGGHTLSIWSTSDQRLLAYREVSHKGAVEQAITEMLADLDA